MFWHLVYTYRVAHDGSQAQQGPEPAPERKRKPRLPLYTKSRAQTTVSADDVVRALMRGPATRRWRYLDEHRIKASGSYCSERAVWDLEP